LPVDATRGTASFVDLLSGDALMLSSEEPMVGLPAWGAVVLHRGTGGTTK